MSDQQKNRIVEWGRDESAQANDLVLRQDEAVRAVRRRFQEPLSEARGWRRLVIWLRMRRAVHLAEKRVEDEVAPRKGLYFSA